MTCGETREYLFAFLDNELDAPLSIELQLHLDGCAVCAREAEIERAVCKRLAKSIEATIQDVPSLDEFLRGVLVSEETRLRTKEPSYSNRRMGWPKNIVAAAVVAFLVVTGAWVVLKDFMQENEPAGFADLVVADFDHFLEGGRAVQIASGDREVVADWLREQTALAVVLPESKDPQCRLMGGRKCKIDGRLAAFAVYDMKGVPASLVAIAAERGDLEGMKEIRHRGRKHWVDRCKGYTVVACRRDELVYAAISRSSQEDLFYLMAGAVNESN